MFDKRNMTITRRAAATGPALGRADRVWQTLAPARLEPCTERRREGRPGPYPAQPAWSGPGDQPASDPA